MLAMYVELKYTYSPLIGYIKVSLSIIDTIGWVLTLTSPSLNLDQE